LTLALAAALTALSMGPNACEAGAEPRLAVALLQMRPAGDDVSANLAKAGQWCRKAADRGADVALMPEMWSIGYTRFDPAEEGARAAWRAKALAKDGAAVQRFAALAKELDMAIGVTYLQDFSPEPRNALTLFDRHGREVFTYAKVHTSDFKAMEAGMTPGDDFFTGALDTKVGMVKVGAMICFDREQPESARILMLKGAEIILTPNACGLDAMRLDQFKVRAFENLVGVAMANYPAPQQNGRSVAFDSEGNCLVKAGSKEGLFMARFDMDRLRAHRAKGIWGNAYRRPHRYGPLTAPDKEAVWRRRDGNGADYDASRR
jgi:predicted amidohydrolase